MYHIRDKLPKKIKIRVYKAFYEPALFYGIECWGSAADYHIYPLKVLQKFAIRMVAGAGHWHHTQPLFSKLKILPLNLLHGRALASVAGLRPSPNSEK